MPTKKQVGERLRLARFKKDMTLKEVASRSGMSATHISEIERGKTSPTIGALQRISKALGERPAHFVEEVVVCPSSLVRRSDRVREFTVSADGQTHDFERLTRHCPWSSSHIIHKVTEPGSVFQRSPVLGELVMVCIDGMLRVTVGDESHALREGDTIQFFMDEGFTVENIGDDRAELICAATYDTRVAW
jgi:transcriptional regulator with XRE-family HTH domain